MRILHTSDLHAGKTLFRQDRTPDLQFALSQIIELVDSQAIDLVLVPGDLYDNYHPSAEASQALFSFFLALHQRNIPSVVIAGNHDSTRHWGALKPLLSLATVHVFHEPNPRNGHLRLKIQGGTLGISALPYPNERQLVRLSEELDGLGVRRSTYAERVARLLAAIAKQTPEGDFQILLSHLMLDGSKPGKGERALSLSDTYTVYAQALPAIYDYIALGHIHRQQQISGSASPAYYCGTPYPMDFGETETAKGVLIIDLDTGKKPQVTFYPLEIKNPLLFLDVHEEALDAVVETHADHQGYVKLRIQTDTRRKGLADQLRAIFGKKLLCVEIHSPRELAQLEKHKALPLEDPLQVYKAYYAALGKDFSPELEKTFNELWEEALQ